MCRCITRSEGKDLEKFDSEIERTLRQRQKRLDNQESTARMAQQPQTMMDYTRPLCSGADSSITRPAVAVNNFEIKPAIIQMIQHSIQFGDLSHEDPNAHIASFLEVCDTFKSNGVSDDAIRLRLFPFSLRDRAKGWLQTLPSGSITSWDGLVEKFLAKYFPPSKTAKL